MIGLLAQTVCSQRPYYIAYSTKNGLLSNTCYDVIQDSKDFLWIATEIGVIRFDGK